MNIIARAKVFANEAHLGQVRKYTGKPYIIHPNAVATMVGATGAEDEVVAAALLHDTLEDTNTTVDDLIENFGNRVARLVTMLTDDHSLKETMGRFERKSLIRKRYGEMSGQDAIDVHTIKTADCIDNGTGHREGDYKFWRSTYQQELRFLSNRLIWGDFMLRVRLLKLLDE